MYSFLNKFPFLELRLFIAVLVSIIMIVIDGKFNIFLSFKNDIEHSIYLFYYVCNSPNDIFYYISKILTDHKKLIAENDTLRKELFFKNSELLLLDQYKQENYKLYALLNSPICNKKNKLITKVLSISLDPYNQFAIINQGSNKNVYVGQPVIADLGIIGQVISVNQFSSRVLLISDPSHALSVKLKHNNIHMILMGYGYNSELYAEYPGIINNEICINDILVTSGLDGCFPAGYPVARVSKIKINLKKDYVLIKAQPIVDLQYLRYAILIWSNIY